MPQKKAARQFRCLSENADTKIRRIAPLCDDTI
jgi:hypothetical protein